MFLGPMIATLFGPNLIGPQKYFLKVKILRVLTLYGAMFVLNKRKTLFEF